MNKQLHCHFNTHLFRKIFSIAKTTSKTIKQYKNLSLLLNDIILKILKKMQVFIIFQS
jgi:hypothetical protein